MRLRNLSGQKVYRKKRKAPPLMLESPKRNHNHPASNL
jgi:hypothetical protein